jgi:hypothetical protein
MLGCATLSATILWNLLRKTPKIIEKHQKLSLFYSAMTNFRASPVSAAVSVFRFCNVLQSKSALSSYDLIYAVGSFYQKRPSRTFDEYVDIVISLLNSMILGRAAAMLSAS